MHASEIDRDFSLKGLNSSSRIGSDLVRIDREPFACSLPTELRSATEEALASEILPDNYDLIGEGDEEFQEAELELDLETDPLQLDVACGPCPEWEAAIRAVQVRKVEIPSADEQRARIRRVVDMLEAETEEPSSEQIEESERWLQNIQSIIPDHNQFIAASFSHHYPAWHELLKNSGRKSARMVLGWIKNEFRPKFAGTTNAKPAKRKIVVEMLRKVVFRRDRKIPVRKVSSPDRVHES
jgi:hypothetical protein